MKIILEVNNQTKWRFLKKEFRKILEHTIEVSNIIWPKDLELEISIAMVEDAEMQGLNREYRKKNNPTDVLSFSEYENIEKLLEEANKGHVFLGELILCPSYIAKNANDDGESFEYAMTYITSHGILHLLGLSHGKKMFSFQREVADLLSKK